MKVPRRDPPDPLPPLLRARCLSAAGFSHGFTTRAGGVSPPPYDSFDLSIQRERAWSSENQARLAGAVGAPRRKLYQASQVHGARLVVAGGDPDATLALEADALVAEPGTGHAVAVRIADCVPMLVADPASGRVAAVHAGWRGVEAGVVGAAVAHLAASSEAGAASGFLAAIGPCIGPCCFEVGTDVAQRIARAVPGENVVMTAEGDSARAKAFVDLRRAVRAQLRAHGVSDEAIEDVPARGREGCTRCDAGRFYSFRRDGEASGRLAAVIVAR